MRIPVVAIIRGSLTGSRSLRRRSIVAEDLAEDLVDLINMALLGNQSRRADAGITGEFDMQTAIEEALRRSITAKALPVRPKPVITSSNTSRMPFLSQISRNRCR